MLLEQKEELQKRENLSRTTVEILEKDQKKLQRKDFKLNLKDEEIQRRGVRIILKKAENRLKEDELNQLEMYQGQRIAQLRQKDDHIISLEEQLQVLRV